MQRNNRITRSLCAVILMLGLLLPGPLGTPAEAAETDIYAIDVEFGNLAFYYDFGTWNVNTMRYEAAVTSSYPARGTTAGFPGWYGFDGTSNKITIDNSKSVDTSSPVTMSLSYRSLTVEEQGNAGASDIITGVTMAVTEDIKGTTLWTDNRVEIAAGGTAVGYIHLSGEPKVNNTETVYDSASMQAIGMLTLKIESPK